MGEKLHIIERNKKSSGEKLHIIEGIERNKKKLYALQREMRQKGRCGMLAMENVWYREAIDKKNTELEVVKEKLREKLECLQQNAGFK